MTYITINDVRFKIIAFRHSQTITQLCTVKDLLADIHIVS